VSCLLHEHGHHNRRDLDGDHATTTIPSGGPHHMVATAVFTVLNFYCIH
jgi:hypothetical protein